VRAAWLVASLLHRRTEARDPAPPRGAGDVRVRLSLFAYERLFADWHTLGYDDKVTERIFHGNAAALLDRLAR